MCMMNRSDILLIHLGGLGDVCLSESTFLSLSRHFGERIIALGNKRFLQLFDEYFKDIESVETRQWMYLFAKGGSKHIWEQIIFIGKDRQGRLRKRWQRLSRLPLIFIDMYPEIATDKTHGAQSEKDVLHVESYQLRQLSSYNINPLIKTITPRHSQQVILYPETGFTKEKWDVSNFITLSERLQSQGIRVSVLQALDTPISVQNRIYIRDISRVKDLFQQGGIFVSNDSGMAHLAGACGLSTITLFSQYNPRIWHPRGTNISYVLGNNTVTIDTLVSTIMAMLTG